MPNMPEVSFTSASSSASHFSTQHITSAGLPSSNRSTPSDENSAHQVDQTRFGFNSSTQNVDLVPHVMGLENTLKSKREFVCGSGAAFINICITFPLNKAIFRQQLHGVSTLRALRQLQKDGLRFLYRGLLPPLLQKTTSMSIMFGSYTRCQELLQDLAPSLPTVPNHTLSALIAGTLEATLTPFERVQTLMQNRHFHDKFSNTLDTFKSLRKLGAAEYYRGLTIIILRNGPSNVFFFLGREYLEKKGPVPKKKSEKVNMVVQN